MLNFSPVQHYSNFSFYPSQGGKTPRKRITARSSFIELSKCQLRPNPNKNKVFPYAGVDYNLTLCLQSTPTHILWVILCQSRPSPCMPESILSPSQRLRIWPLGDGVVVRRELEDVTAPAPSPFYIRFLDKYLKTTWTVYSPLQIFASELSPHSDLRISFNTFLVR